MVNSIQFQLVSSIQQGKKKLGQYFPNLWKGQRTSSLAPSSPSLSNDNLNGFRLPAQSNRESNRAPWDGSTVLPPPMGGSSTPIRDINFKRLEMKINRESN